MRLWLLVTAPLPLSYHLLFRLARNPHKKTTPTSKVAENTPIMMPSVVLLMVSGPMEGLLAVSGSLGKAIVGSAVGDGCGVMVAVGWGVGVRVGNGVMVMGGMSKTRPLNHTAS